MHTNTRHQITINKGCFIVFDSALVHGGAAFQHHEGPCYRIHSFIMDKNTDPPDGSKTPKSVNDCANCNICQQVEIDEALKYVLHNGKLCSFCYLYTIFFVSLFELISFLLTNFKTNYVYQVI